MYVTAHVTDTGQDIDCLYVELEYNQELIKHNLYSTQLKLGKDLF